MNYNYGQPISIDNLNKDDWIQAATDFSEGLDSLKQLLLCMWENGIKTFACCKGYHYINNSQNGPLDILYPTEIVLQQNNDVFSYLSEEIINSPYVKLGFEFEKQLIYIYGEKRDEILQKIIKDILSGKKNNIIIYKEPQSKIRVESYVYGLRINGFSDEEIEPILPKLIEFAQFFVDPRTFIKNKDKYSKLELDSYFARHEETVLFLWNYILKKQQSISENKESYHSK